MAAVLACGSTAALSHRSAAVLHGFLRSWAPAIDVTIRDRSGRARPGMAVHRPRVVHPDEVADVGGIPVTTAERTLLDLADVVPRGPIERACDEAERLHAIDWMRVGVMLERHPGRVAAKRLHRVLAELGIGTAPTRSVLEREFLALCATHALVRPEVNVIVEGHEVDFWWSSHRLVVETDGHAFHAPMPRSSAIGAGTPI